jgi:hypothetical protein
MWRTLFLVLALTMTLLGCGSDPVETTGGGGQSVPKCTPGESVPCDCAGTASTGICGVSETLAQCECGIGTPGTPKYISISPASALEAEDHLAVTRDGVIAVAWISIDPSGGGSGYGGIGYSVSKDRGESWSVPQQVEVDPSRPDVSDPVLASDGTNLYLGWMAFRRVGQTDISNMAIRVAKLAPGETAFGESVIAGRAPGGGDKPWMGVTKSGAVLISYMTRAGGGQAINVSKSTDGGASWTNAVLPSAQGNFVVPCASADSDRVWAVYNNFANSALLTVRWSDDDGDTWPAANRKEITSVPVVQPASCMARGSDVFVAYPYVRNLQSQEQPGEEYHVVRFDGTDSPTEVVATDKASSASHLGLLVPEDLPGTLTLLYYGGKGNPDPNGALRMTRSTDNGATWSESAAISSTLLFTTKRDGFEWLGDYLGGAQLGNELFVAYGENTQKVQNFNVNHIAFVKVTRP